MRKFTLIELLVVVAIIGILASLLLPALGKARKTSRTGVCTSNLKQVAQAGFMYLDDNGDYFPGRENHGGQGAVTVPYAYVGKAGTTGGFNKSSQFHAFNLYMGIKSNAPEVTVAMCPNDDFDMVSNTAGKTYNALGTSYFGNGENRDDLAASNTSDNGGVNISQVTVKSSKMVFITEIGGWHRAYGSTNQWARSWHGGQKYGTAFLDGHVINLFIANNQISSSTFSFTKN